MLGARRHRPPLALLRAPPVAAIGPSSRACRGCSAACSATAHGRRRGRACGIALRTWPVPGRGAAARSALPVLPSPLRGVPAGRPSAGRSRRLRHRHARRGAASPASPRGPRRSQAAGTRRPDGPGRRAAEHAARGERARIARELHDVVAHHISMIAVQAETARLTTPGLPADGAQRLLGDRRHRAGRADRDAAAARRAAGGRRHRAPTRAPQPGLQQLNDLLDEARDAVRRRSTRLIVTAPCRRSTRASSSTAYRIVQEALTNVAPARARRGGRRRAATTPTTAAVRVRDNGPGPSPVRGHRRARPARHARAGRHGRRRLTAGSAPSAASSSRPTCRPIGPATTVIRDRGRRRPGGRARRLRARCSHPARLRAWSARRADGARGGAVVPRAAARRRPDGRADAGHGRHRGDPPDHASPGQTARGS